MLFRRVAWAATIAAVGIAGLGLVAWVYFRSANVEFSRQAAVDKLDLHAVMIRAMPNGTRVDRAIHILQSGVLNRYAKSHGLTGWFVTHDIQKYAAEGDVGNSSGTWPGGTIIFASSQSPDGTKEMFIHLHFSGKQRYIYYTVDEYQGRAL